MKSTNEIQGNLKKVKKRLEDSAKRSGRNPDDIRLILVTKGVGVDRIKEVLNGVEDPEVLLGESFFQESRDKIQFFSRENYPIKWHFIGHLQTNKSKYIARYFDYLHTLDSMNLASELNRNLEKINKKLPVLIQVNVGGENQKHGISPDYLSDFIIELEKFSNLIIKGLMTIHPYSKNTEESRKWFKYLRQLRDMIEIKHQLSLSELSMGMSEDFEIAIEEGATFVRIGREIFGERK